MGLFDSSYRTHVGTTVSRVVADSSIISSIKTGAIRTVFQKGDLIDNITETMVSSVGVRAERMYAYGKKSYPFGLPSSKLYSSADGKSVVTGVLRSLVGVGATLDYYHFGALNNLHVGWVYLFNNYGYNSISNELSVLSTQKATPVYLKDMVVVVKEASLAERANGSLDQWGSAACGGYTPQRIAALKPFAVATPFAVDPLAAGDYVLVTYVWQGTTNVLVDGVTVQRTSLQEQSIQIPITGYDLEASYFQVKYILNNKEGYWLYKLGSGVHTEIDDIYSTDQSSSGSFFPFGYLRHNKTSPASDSQSAEYKASSKLMKYLGMDFASTVDAIHENPGIADVEQAILMLAVPANTSNPMEQRYLFDFFSKLYSEADGIGVEIGGEDSTDSKGTSLEVSRIQYLMGMSPPKISLTIQDSRMKMALSCRAIYKRKKAGSIGKVGSYASKYLVEDVTHNHSEIIYDDLGFPQNSAVVDTWTVPVSTHVYQHQITDILYEEVQVYELRMTYHVWGAYTTTGDETSAILMIPLDHAITQGYSIPDRELLYTRSLHYVFNSRVIQEIKWYQSDWFQFVMVVAAIVITVVSMGGDGGSALAAVVAGKMTVTAFIAAVAMGIVEYVATSMAFKLFADKVGVEFAFLVAIAAALAGSYKAYQAGSIAGAPTAQKLLTLSSNLVSGVNASLKSAMIGLQNELEAFNTLAKEKSSLLEEANKLLEPSNVLSSLVIFGESPDDFYNRTVHAGNIGVVGIDSISSYVDIALTLPKLDETIGRNSYVY